MESSTTFSTLSSPSPFLSTPTPYLFVLCPFVVIGILSKFASSSPSLSIFFLFLTGFPVSPSTFPFILRFFFGITSSDADSSARFPLARLTDRTDLRTLLAAKPELWRLAEPILEALGGVAAVGGERTVLLSLSRFKRRMFLSTILKPEQRHFLPSDLLQRSSSGTSIFNSLIISSLSHGATLPLGVSSLPPPAAERPPPVFPRPILPRVRSQR
nr:hypothetical protein Iba_chr02cCG4320 [Ipomoea batatas]